MPSRPDPTPARQTSPGAGEDNSDFTAQQLYGALVALGRASESDAPDTDIPRMAGALLAAIEQAIMMQAATAEDRVFAAYHAAAAPNTWIPMLWNRLARTRMELTRIVGSPVVDASETALRAAVRMLQIAVRFGFEAELQRTGQPPQADGVATIGRAFRDGRQALADAHRRFEQVGKQLAELGYPV